MNRSLAILRILAVVLVACSLGQYVGAETPMTFSILNARGTVQYKAAGAREWTIAHERMPLRVGDSVRTAANSSCIIRVSRDNHALLGSNTTIVVAHAERRSTTGRFAGVIPSRGQAENITIIQLAGVVHSINHRVRATSSYRLVTPVAVTAVRGTEWFSAFGAGQVQPVDRFAVEVLPSPNGGPLVNLQFLGPNDQPVGTFQVGIPPADRTGATGFQLRSTGQIFTVNSGVTNVDGVIGVSQGDVEAVTLDNLNSPAALITGGQTWSFQVPTSALINPAGGGFGPLGGGQFLGGPGGLPGGPGGLAGALHDQNRTVTHQVHNLQGGIFGSAIDRVSEGTRASLFSLSNFSIGNFNTLSSSLSSFLSGFVTYSNLDSAHPINGGTISWIQFSPTDIRQIHDSLQ